MPSPPRERSAVGVNIPENSVFQNAWRQPAETHRFTPAKVSRMTRAEIERMTNAELARIIRAIRSSHMQVDLNERLEYMDRLTLIRLVYLTQRYCHNLSRSEVIVDGPEESLYS